MLLVLVLMDEASPLHTGLKRERETESPVKTWGDSRMGRCRSGKSIGGRVICLTIYSF